MLVTYIGHLTGRAFEFDRARPLGAPGVGSRFQGREVETGADVLVQWAEDASGRYPIDVYRTWRAIAMGQHPAVRRCAQLRQLIDFQELRLTYKGKTDVVLIAFWEWGDTSLRTLMDAGAFNDSSALAEDVRSAVEAALDALHSAGFVHCDVAPNNILRVAGKWTLADLDCAVREGQSAIGIPQPRYRAASSEVGEPVRTNWDEAGLRAVVDEILETARA